MGKHRFARVSVATAVVVVVLVAGVVDGSAGGSQPLSRAASPAASTEALPTGPIGHVGRWLTDADGRVFLGDGVNAVDKSATATAQEFGELGFGDDDATWLAANGINMVRLGFTAATAMPTAGHLDEAYIDSYVQEVEDLQSHGIEVLVDLHQDGWGPSLGDDGFPGWMTLTHGVASTHTTFPLYYVTNPAIQAAFDSFWADDKGTDGVPLQSHIASIFADLAGKLKNDPGVLGYDLVNEPWPGTVWNACEADANGCPTQDHDELDAYYARMAGAIRGAGDRHLLFGEPFVLFNFGESGTNIGLPGGDANSGMSFHMYTTTPADEPGVIDNVLAWTKKTGGALLGSEFGATTVTGDIDRQAKEFDHALIPWIFWAYQTLMNGVGTSPASDANVVGSVADAVIRPHPVLVAGTPSSLDYDLPNRVMRFSYSTTGAAGQDFADGSSVTSFQVAPRTYPHGYQVQVSGGTVTSAANALDLTVVADPGVKRVSVTIWDATEATPPAQTVPTTTPPTTAPPAPSTTTTTTTTEPSLGGPIAPPATPIVEPATFTG